ncbi:transposable element Tcb2 transposase [Trichonephila clavipes]|nr:transposable element Tcb2 transposase [Trichonephila clavipes]
MEAGWSAWGVARQLGRYECVVRKCWDQWIREMSFTQRPGSGRLDKPVFEKTTTSEEMHAYSQLLQRLRSRHRSEDNRVRVWRPYGERFNPVFALQQHTTFTADVILWGAIAYNTRSPLVFIHGIMTAQRYVKYILNHMCCRSFNGSLEPFFNEAMLRFTQKGCHKTVFTLFLPFHDLPDTQICFQSSISGIIWDGELSTPRV